MQQHNCHSIFLLFSSPCMLHIMLTISICFLLQLSSCHVQSTLYLSWIWTKQINTGKLQITSCRSFHHSHQATVHDNLTMAYRLQAFHAKETKDYFSHWHTFIHAEFWHELKINIGTQGLKKPPHKYIEWVVSNVLKVVFFFTTSPDARSHLFHAMNFILSKNVISYLQKESNWSYWIRTFIAIWCDDYVACFNRCWHFVSAGFE